MFSSPLGDFFLYTRGLTAIDMPELAVLVPLRGFLFIYAYFIQRFTRRVLVLVPLRGFLFIYQKRMRVSNLIKFSSPLGDFFLYTKIKSCNILILKFSSPLGDFFLYTICEYHIPMKFKFSSPLGDFFLYTVMDEYEIKEKMFSSPLGDFFLYTLVTQYGKEFIVRSRPPQGISFYIQLKKMIYKIACKSSRPPQGISFYIPCLSYLLILRAFCCPFRGKSVCLKFL